MKSSLSDEIPSDDWTRDVGFDCRELVGLPAKFDLEALAAEALDLVAVDGPEAHVWVRLISRIGWPGADLGTGIDEDVHTLLCGEMRPYVDPLMAHCPREGVFGWHSDRCWTSWKIRALTELHLDCCPGLGPMIVDLLDL